jgi:ABC-type nitrate/sulfonate/bicarbonate transport system substrate-binding protein
VKLLAWAADIAPWQFGALITSAKLADGNPDRVKRFLAAMHQADGDYHDAFTAPDGTRQDQADAPALYQTIAGYIGQSVEQLRPALAYVDGAGRMDVEDVLHQIAWYRDHGFLNNATGAEKIVDKRFVVPMTLGQRGGAAH